MKIVVAMCCAALAACASVSSSEQRLLDADRSFARDVQARRIEGWVAAFDEHGSQVDDEFRPVTGHVAIRAHMTELFADPALELTWEPDRVALSEAGNLGTTSGRFRLLQTRPDGARETLLVGRYFDVWRKLPDGTWKLLYDLGEPDAARL
jgi:ketosteroid isomerase-like protein